MSNIKNILDTVEFNEPGIFAGEIEDAAINGVIKGVHKPKTQSSAIVTGLMRVMVGDLTDAGMDADNGEHLTAGYDMLSYIGNNNCSYGFVHQAKLNIDGLGTYDSISCYKPSINDINGVVSFFKLIDCEMDLSGISGAVGTAFSVFAPDTDKKMMQRGGYFSDVIFPAGDLTLENHHSGKIISFITGSTQTVTIPSTLDPSFWCLVEQLDANQINFVGSGGLFVGNVYGHTKTAGAAAKVHVSVTNGTYANISMDTGV